MSDKDYGSVLSKYLDPEGRNYDTVVYQKGTQLLDSEFVLDQDLQNQARSEAVQNSIPSGWLSGDFKEDTNQDFSFPSTSNLFKLVNKPVVNVNGWVFPVEYTNTTTSGENEVTLDAPPSGTGTVAADFVYIEVWRALIGANPSSTNKPQADKIYRHGNVNSPSGVWLDDELVHPDVGSETSKRVQVQYRLKSERMNNKDNRIGYDDVNIKAQGPNGGLTSWSYSKDTNDPGLWVAGDGSPSNSLNTVDGYVYSIPVGIVFRRNDSGFDFSSNVSGGVNLSNGSSDRPDGYYADKIEFQDLLDQRHHVDFTGVDWEQKCDRSMNLLYGQNLRTWVADSTHAGWDGGAGPSIGNRHLMADDVVPSGTDLSSGNTIGSPDGIRRVFTDRAYRERHVRRYSPPGGNWNAGDQITIDLTTATGDGTESEMPNGTKIIDINSMVVDEGQGNGGQVKIDPEKITGLGTLNVSIYVDPPVDTFTRDIWVEYEVYYPSGSGLSAHVTETMNNFGYIVHNPSSFNSDIGTTFTDDASGRSAIRSYLDVNYEDGPHREVDLSYTTDSSETRRVISKDDKTIVIPEFLDEDHSGTTKGVVSVVEDPTGSAINHTVDGLNTNDRTIKLSSTLNSNEETVDVTYYPSRPFSINGSETTLYYNTAGTQAIEYEYTQNDDPLTIRPVWVSDRMWIGNSSSGSYQTPTPFEAPLDQIPVHKDASFDGEEDLNLPTQINIEDFSTDNGLISLPNFIRLANFDSIDLQTPADIQSSDNHEFVDHYTDVDITNYRPEAETKKLNSNIKHKCYLPVVGRLEQDTDFAQEGAYVLLIFANYINGRDNKIKIEDSNNTTCIAVYRLKGNPLEYI